MFILAALIAFVILVAFDFVSIFLLPGRQRIASDLKTAKFARRTTVNAGLCIFFAFFGVNLTLIVMVASAFLALDYYIARKQEKRITGSAATAKFRMVWASSMV